MPRNEDLPDEEIVRRCRAGDTASFEAVIQRYQNMIYGFALSKVSDVGIAQDLVQETFLLGFELLPRLNDPQRLKQWLTGITYNLVRDHYKRRKLAGMPEHSDVVFAGMDPLQSLEEKERHELLFKAMATLSERYRTVLVMRYLRGLDAAKISAELGISTGAVEVCMFRARKALAGALREYMPEE